MFQSTRYWDVEKETVQIRYSCNTKRGKPVAQVEIQPVGAMVWLGLPKGAAGWPLGRTCTEENDEDYEEGLELSTKEIH